MCECILSYIFFIHSWVEGHLDGFQFWLLWIKSIQTYLGKHPFGILEHTVYMSRSVIALSWGRSVPNFLRNSHINFQSGKKVVYTFISNEGVFPLLQIISSMSYNWSFWSKPFRQVYGRIPESFWFVISWWLMMLNISFSTSQPFEIPLLKILCLDHYPFI